MKKTILLTIIALFFTLISYGQELDSILRKGAYKVVVKNDLSAKENYEKVKALLMKHRTEIRTSDPEFYRISTGRSPTKMYKGFLFSNAINCYDNEIVIRTFQSVWTNTDVGIRQEDQWAFVFRNDKFTKLVFSGLTEFATELGGKIFYEYKEQKGRRKSNDDLYF